MIWGTKIVSMLYTDLMIVLSCLMHTIHIVVSRGGLGVTCSCRDQRLAGSNPAEVNVFFQDVKT